MDTLVPMPTNYGKFSYPEGASTVTTTTRLPIKHSSNRTGLTIKDVDESHNMTSYSCLFQVYNRDEIVLVASSVGMLVVLETIFF